MKRAITDPMIAPISFWLREVDLFEAGTATVVVAAGGCGAAVVVMPVSVGVVVGPPSVTTYVIVVYGLVII